MKTKNPPITLGQAIAGYKLNLSSRRLSPHTISDYNNSLKKFQDYIGNPIITEITRDQVQAFLAACQVSNKTARNYCVCLSSLWKWLKKSDLVKDNIIEDIDRPRPERRVITILEPHEIKTLLQSIDKTRPYARPGKKTCTNHVPFADRNRALLFFMLDNGVRVSEISNLKIKDLDVKNSRAFILGKGSKERWVPYSPRTASAIWKYLTQRPDHQPDDPLFATGDNRRPLTPRHIQELLETIATRAGISGVHPHRFRHTFAVTYLRAGGDVFTLQMILGHEDLDMVRHYSRLAETDVRRVHRLASPVEYLNL